MRERRPEPQGGLNKGHTERTSPGLPFHASYACTSMHEFAIFLFLNDSLTINPYQSGVKITD